MERFSKTVNDFQSSNIFAKRPSQMLDKLLNMPLKCPNTPYSRSSCCSSRSSLASLKVCFNFLRSLKTQWPISNRVISIYIIDNVGNRTELKKIKQDQLVAFSRIHLYSYFSLILGTLQQSLHLVELKICQTNKMHSY